MGQERRSCNFPRHVVGVDSKKHLDGFHEQIGRYAMERFQGKLLSKYEVYTIISLIWRYQIYSSVLARLLAEEDST
jgi:hypothetical protein